MKSNIRNSILPTAALCGLAIAAGIVTGALTTCSGACRFCRLPAF